MCFCFTINLLLKLVSLEVEYLGFCRHPISGSFSFIYDRCYPLYVLERQWLDNRFSFLGKELHLTSVRTSTAEVLAMKSTIFSLVIAKCFEDLLTRVLRMLHTMHSKGAFFFQSCNFVYQSIYITCSPLYTHDFSRLFYDKVNQSH